MSDFLQLHLLTAYPPSNLNRDDLGRPKTAVVGGTERLRVSSQSLKRAWRTSSVFEEALGGHIGTRTKRFGEELHARLLAVGADAKKAEKWVGQIIDTFAKRESKKLVTGQLVHYSSAEMEACRDLVDTLARENRAATDDELGGLRGAAGAVDMALFGRMLAENADANVDASVQVAHAISVNPVAVEEDYFTAVDDLNVRDDQAGAGHIGEAGFGSGVFYLYVCVDRDLLRENLKGDTDLWARSLRSLTEAAATVAPSGKQNSFGSRARASYILVERGPQQPRSLSVAFLKAIRGGDPLDDAVLAIERQRDQFDRAYGACADDRDILNVNAGEGSLGAILDFVEG